MKHFDMKDLKNNIDQINELITDIDNCVDIKQRNCLAIDALYCLNNALTELLLFIEP